MIRIPTCLILGAGASMPFGYPLGRKLVEQIVAGCEGGGALFQELRSEGFQLGEIEGFRHFLLNSHHDSIDAFLEHNPDFSDIGKCSIVAEIQRATPGPQHRNWDWYSDLWRALSSNASPQNFTENKLSVVTFNYDCSFEHFLGNAITATFRRNTEAQYKLLQTVPIEHVYGRIPFCSNRNGATLRELSKEIKIIHDEAEAEDQGLVRARNLISEAQRVCILGFGFHEMNLRRLSIHKGCVEQNLLSNRVVYATCMGFTDAELWDLRNRCLLGSQLFMGIRSWGSKALIREFGAFLPHVYNPGESYHLYSMSLGA